MRGAIHLMQYADFYLTYYLLSAMITVSVTALAFSPDSTVKPRCTDPLERGGAGLIVAG